MLKMEKDQVIEITNKEAIKAIKAVKSSKIHCFIGFIGADWDKTRVMSLAKKAKRIAWADNMFKHNLAIIYDGRLHSFDLIPPNK